MDTEGLLERMRRHLLELRDSDTSSNLIRVKIVTQRIRVSDSDKLKSWMRRR
jgi:hypothetical protein